MTREKKKKKTVEPNYTYIKQIWVPYKMDSTCGTCSNVFDLVELDNIFMNRQTQHPQQSMIANKVGLDDGEKKACMSY